MGGSYRTNDNPRLRDTIPDVKDGIPNVAHKSPKWLGHKEIGLRVKAVRDRLGVSQGEFAERVGLAGGQSDIGKIERGVLWKEGNDPNVGLLVKIAALADEGVEFFQASTGIDIERRNRLIVAQWYAAEAERLRHDATPPARPSLEPASAKGKNRDPGPLVNTERKGRPRGRRPPTREAGGGEGG